MFLQMIGFGLALITMAAIGGVVFNLYFEPTLYQNIPSDED